MNRIYPKIVCESIESLCFRYLSIFIPVCFKPKAPSSLRRLQIGFDAPNRQNIYRSHLQNRLVSIDLRISIAEPYSCDAPVLACGFWEHQRTPEPELST